MRLRMASGQPKSPNANHRMKLLIVEDSDALRETLKRGLSARGIAVDAVGRGEEALTHIGLFEYDVIVLDLMLPGIDGKAVLQKVRGRDATARVLVLSAIDHIGEKVKLLELGADDYLAKPFDFEELVARISALGRRGINGKSSFVAGPLHLDSSAKVASVHGEPLPLGPKEYALLEVLLRNRGRCLSRALLFEKIYESNSNTSDRVIEVVLCTLRAKLSQVGCQNLIETKRGLGYCVA